MFAASKSAQATGGAPPPPPPTPTTDPQFPYVTALLTGDGTNGAQNNTFIDSSPNNFAITRYGNTTQGSASPYGGNWSNYFDGSSYLTVPAGTAFAAGTGDFTFECWIYTSSVNDTPIYESRSTSSNTDGFTITALSSTVIRVYTSSVLVSATVSNYLNTWTHIAFTRQGNTNRLFVNGALGATSTASDNFSNPQAFIAGGRYLNNSISAYFTGHISNLRLVKGTAVYTSNFTPSTTPLTAITNTSLLTCQSPRFVDNSFNNFTVTNNGNTSTQVFSPFEPATLTPISYSGSFDGSGDYLSLATNVAFNITSGSTDSFICEFWVYFSSVAANTSLVDNGGLSGATLSNWNIQLNASQQFGIVWGNEGAQQGILASSTVPTIGQWYHIALVKTNADWALFINGARGISYNGINTASKSSATPLFIAYGITTSAGGNGFNGVISNVRIYNGATATAPYLATSTTITVPTSPLTAITNTSLLTCQSNTFVDNSPNKFAITPFGDAKTTIQNPFGNFNYSQYLDGSGDYLSVPANSAFTLGTNDHTIEFYYYLPSTALVGGYATQWQLDSSASGQASNSYYFQIGTAGGSNVALLLGAGGSWGVLMQPSISVNSFVGVWTHIAFTRSGSTFRLFFNGVQAATATYSGSITAQSGPMFIGRDGGGNYAGGYYSNFRINKGTAVYTSNFVPPTQPLTAITNTSLLTCQNLGAIDNSTNAFTLTAYGNTSGSTFNPFPPTPAGFTSALTTGYSASVASGSVTLNGSSNVLTGPTSNTLFQLTANGGTGLTVEAWIYPTSVAGSRQIATYYNYNDGGAEQGWYFRVLDGQLIAGNAFGGTSRGGGSIPVNTWTHVAFVINSGSFYVYVNGVSVGTTTGVGSQSYSSATLEIGGIKQNGSYTNQVFNGSISNLRTTNTAVYTANFTPSTTPLTAISGTTLLTCQSSTSITDASSNGFTITRVGTPVTTVANPFGITSVNGASMYFDGNGDYLNAPNNAAFGFGTGDFTIEGWFYFTGNVGTYQRPWWFGDDNENLEILSSVIRFGGASITLITGPTAVANTWYHIAYSRASGSGRLFVNGVQGGATTASSYNSSARTFTVMATSGGANPSTGYVSNVRIVKGTALYTANFVPPVAPVTVVSGTSLLLNGTNGGIIDNAMMNNYETVGNAQISTAVVKYGTGSMYFDGTGDYLSIYNPSYSVSVGSGDFTYECWVYLNTLPGIVSSFYHLKNDVGLASTVFILELTAAGAISLSTGTALIVSGTAGKITTGSWIHFAFVRTSGVFKTFFNGIQDISVANTTAYNGTYVQIGAWRYGGYDFSINGYIDDLRITKGYARYVANFTPPTQAFPTY